MDQKLAGVGGSLKRFSRKLGVVAAFAFVAIAPAIAAGSDSTKTDDALEEVVVTAERHEQNLQRAPLTVQVVSGDALQGAGISSPADLEKVTTGVDIGEGGANHQIFIRGVGSFAYSPLSTPGVAFNVDGVYVGRPDGIGSNFYDVARVEVLKGPQGTLYGRNANGGSINVITNDPKLNSTSGDLSAEFGNFGLVHIDGALNAPIGGFSALRVAFNVVNRQGYLSDGTDDDYQQAGRLRYKMIPNDDVTVQFSADYTHLGGRGGGSVWLPRRSGSDPWEATTAAAANDYLHSFLPLGPLIDDQRPDSHQNSSFFNTSLELDWNLGFGTLTVLPAYRHVDTNSLAYNGLRYDEKERTQQKTVEARLGNSLERFTWVVGGYYFNESSNGSINVYQSNILQNYLIDYQPVTKSGAAFGQATISLRDDFRMIVGGRYTREQAELAGSLNNLATVPASLIEGFGGNKTFTGSTYKGGFEYDLAPANLLYVTYSTGFKSGGFSQTVAPVNVFQPEHLNSLEIGSKNRFLDNRLQANFSLYQWKYKDLQDQRVNFDPLGHVNFITYNSGDATIKGATMDVIARVSSADTVSLSTEYASSRYSSYFFQTPAIVFQPTSSACRISGPYAPGAALPYTDSNGNNTNVGPLPVVVGNCEGFQVARVPKWTGRLEYDHVFTLADTSTITFSSTAKFSTSSWLNIDFIPAERNGEYTVLDADLTYANARWSFGLFGRNLADRANYTGGLQQSFVGGLFAANIAAPRTYGIHANYRFGE
jgi:iron complex outermembrane receptor protein